MVFLLLLYTLTTTSIVTQSHIRTSRSFFAPYTSKLMRHTPSGEHPYLAVRLRDSLTRRYGRRSLMSCQRTTCHKEESNLNFVPAIRTTHTGYGLLYYV